MSLTIGLMAYHAVGNAVFVRVPSERGRYMLTDACVVLVACRYCDAIKGEPCRGLYRDMAAHSVTVHAGRRSDARHQFGKGYGARIGKLVRLRLHAEDVAAALGEITEECAWTEPADIDVPVTPRSREGAS